jgi:hypothetical protein
VVGRWLRGVACERQRHHEDAVVVRGPGVVYVGNVTYDEVPIHEGDGVAISPQSPQVRATSDLSPAPETFA